MRYNIIIGVLLLLCVSSMIADDTSATQAQARALFRRAEQDNARGERRRRVNRSFANMAESFGSPSTSGTRPEYGPAQAAAALERLGAQDDARLKESLQQSRQDMAAILAAAHAYINGGNSQDTPLGSADVTETLNKLIDGKTNQLRNKLNNNEHRLNRGESILLSAIAVCGVGAVVAFLTNRYAKLPYTKIPLLFRPLVFIGRYFSHQVPNKNL